MKRWLRTPLAVTLALLAPAAFAQTPTPTGAPPAPPAPTAQPAPPALGDALHGDAKAAYDSAKLLLANNDSAGALEKFKQAYELSKDPRLLYNMAICNKNLRAYARMKTLLERYERDAGATMTPDERASVNAALAAINNLVGALKLTVTPDGASVLLDGTPAATSPVKEPIFAELGKHTLTIKMSSFDPVEKAIDVAGGNEIALTVALTPTPHVADLVVATDDAATVSIDGQVVGTGRYQARLASGRHSVHVTEPGRKAVDSDLDLRDGETRTLEVSLPEEKHGAIWPWVVGGAVVVGAAVVGGYFLFKPSDTTVPPPQGALGGVQFSSFRR